MDLVAQVAYSVLNIMQPLDSESKALGDQFSLTLYVSFQSRQDAIGLDLLEALNDFCKKKQIKCFSLVTRISTEGRQRRWDNDWIMERIKEVKDLKKAWVCGPPIMNETFDRAFEAIQASSQGVYAHGTFEVL